MAQNYTRQSTFSDGDTITSSLFNDEYNQLVNAFTYSSTSASTTGHRHDGTAGQGGNIFKIGDLDFLNKIEVDSTNNRLGFYVEVSSAAVEQIRIQDGSVVPVTTNDIDLGTSSLQFKDLYIDGTANVDSLTLTSGSTVTSILDQDDMSGNSATALATQQSIKAYVDSQVGTVDTLAEILANGNATGGTNIAFGDNDKALFGASSDLQIYHDGSDSYIDDTGTGRLRLRGAADIILAHPTNGETYAVFSANGANTFYYDNAEKLATTAAGIDVTGTVTADTLDVDSVKIISGQATTPTNDASALIYRASSHSDYANGDLIIQARSNASRDIYMLTGTTTPVNRLQVNGNGDISFYEDTGTTAKLTWDASDEDLKFADSSKAIFGAGDDLQIYHNGSNSYIDDAGTGSLVIRGNAVNIGKYTGETAAVFTADGSVQLRYDNSAKFETTSTGIDVTGSVVSDGLTVDGDGSFAGDFEISGLSPKIFLSETDTTNVNTRIRNSAGKLQIQTVDNSDANPVDRFQIDHATGDISFYEDTGTTAKFFWDASAESLGIGTSSPAEPLHVQEGSSGITSKAGTVALIEGSGNTKVSIASGTTSTGELLFGSSADNDAGRVIYDHSDDGLQLWTNGARAVDIDSSGNVGIGTSSPTDTLSVGTLGSGSNSIITIGASTTGTSSIYFGDGASSARFRGYFDYVHSSDSLAIGTAAAERMRIDSSGNVGIGTSSPSRELHISKAGQNGVRLTSTAFGADFGLLSSVGGTNGFGIYDYTASAYRFNINSSGNVGIGTSSPSNPLHVATASTDVAKFATTGAYNFITLDNATRNWALSVGSTFSIYDSTAASTRMSVDSSGNVGIGTSLPEVGLHVKTAAAGAMTTFESTGTSASGGPNIRFWRNSDSPADGDALTKLIFQGNNDAAERIDYVKIQTEIVDASDGTEDALLQLETYVGGVSRNRLRVNGTESVFNDGGHDLDFRVESADKTHMLFVDAGNNAVGINNSSPQKPLHVYHASIDNVVRVESGDSRSRIEIADGDTTVVPNIGVVGNNFTVDTNGSERMRIDSSGNLLVGTTETDIGFTASGAGCMLGPEGTLQLARNSANELLYLNKLGGNDGDIIRLSTDGNEIGVLGVRANYLKIGNGDTQLLFNSGSDAITPEGASDNRDAAIDLGRTVSRFKDLHLSGTANVSGAAVLGTNATNVASIGTAAQRVYIKPNGTEIIYNASGNTVGQHVWQTGNAERMRIDGDGNVLVGKTSSNYTVAGAELRDHGTIGATTTTQTPFFANRTTDDGALFEFYRGAATVGSIGTYAGDLTIGDDDVGIRFDTGTGLVPWDLGANSTGGAATNGAIDIGAASARFKDLYLSGGVYLGGTGSANHLDDYEEGTFTGAVADASSGGNESSSNLRGTYVKVGAVVYVQFNVSNIITTGMTAGNDVFITGLPFASKSVAGTAKYTGTANLSAVTFEQTPILQVNEGGTFVKIMEIRSGAGNDSIVVSQLSSGTSDIHGNLVYETA